MSDDEDDVVYVKKTKHVHYGSLEEQERARLALLAKTGDDEVQISGKELGDIQISNEYMKLEDEISRDKLALLEEFERRRKARQLNVSTDDDEVRRNLRQLGEPVCLFGEGPADRRIRLRDLLSYLGEDAIHKRMEEEEAREEQSRIREGTWYHEGPPELKEARLWIARYSLPRAKERLIKAREYMNQPASVRAAAKQDAQRKASAMAIYCSQVGDSRPLSFCRFSDDSKMLAIASWSGQCKLWSVPDCRHLMTLKGHTCNVSCIVFRPGVTMHQSFCAKDIKGEMREEADMDIVDEKSEALSMVSCAFDGTVCLWNFSSSEPIGRLDGHSPHRVSRVEFHPSGRYLGTTCHDSSWRFWDLEREREVLHQEGHQGPVYSVGFHCDGSLAATGGMDAYGRVWDLRTGRCVMFLEGHLGAVLGVAWSPCGRRLVTCAADNSAKAWDLRKRTSVYTIPAHTGPVSGVRFQPNNGHFMVTSSYDKTAKVWSSPTWQPLKCLTAHDNKVMCCDISCDGKIIATTSFDRTFKLWMPELT